MKKLNLLGFSHSNRCLSGPLLPSISAFQAINAYCCAVCASVIYYMSACLCIRGVFSEQKATTTAVEIHNIWYACACMEEFARLWYKQTTTTVVIANINVCSCEYVCVSINYPP